MKLHPEYAEYREQVPMLVPGLRRRVETVGATDLRRFNRLKSAFASEGLAGGGAPSMINRSPRGRSTPCHTPD